MNSPNRWSLPYAPGLDGVRAMAVSAVLLYHGGVGIPGGFLGVDIFFALSGFLITTLLIGEWERHGKIRLLAFWGRRALRLLPALFLVILAISLYIVFFAEPAKQSQVRGDALSALFYVSNWRFVAVGQSYFDQFSSPSPLLHTWSLAIEEQFYLVFPIVLIGLLTWLGLKARRLAIVFFAGALLSAAWMWINFQPGTDPSRVYYGTDTRIQTLLIGAVGAAIIPALRNRPAIRRLAPVFGGVGLIGLVVAFKVVSDSSPVLFHGGFLVVALLSLLLITAIQLDARWLVKMFSLRPLVALGVISYGVYLWHWPIYLVLTPVRVGLDGWPLLFVRVFVSIVIATASFYFVEAPIRFHAFASAKASQRIKVTGAAVIACVTALFVATTVATSANASSAKITGPQLNYDGPPIIVYTAGDSNAWTLSRYFPQDLSNALLVENQTMLGCGITADSHMVGGTRLDVAPACRKWLTRLPQIVDSLHPDIGLLFAGSWEQLDQLGPNNTEITPDNPAFKKHLTDEYASLLKMLHSRSNHVAAVTNHCHGTPDFGVQPPVPAQINSLDRVAVVNEALEAAAAQVPFPVTVIDLNSYLCSDGYTNDWNGTTLRSDGLHFTEDGSRIVWNWLTPQLIEIQEGSESTPTPTVR